jgi:hypothetical protein
MTLSVDGDDGKRQRKGKKKRYQASNKDMVFTLQNVYIFSGLNIYDGR